MTKIDRPIRILVLDADLVPALAVTRSLVSQNYLVDVASAAAAPIASFSKWVGNCWQYPHPLQGEEPFLAWLEAHLAHNPYDLVIPVTERTLVPLSAQRQRFSNTRFAMADEESLNRVLNKAETFKLAESLGVSVPHSSYVSDICQLDALSVELLSYPLVVKPSRSVAGGGTGYSKRNVSYAHNEAEMRRLCEECLQHSPVILQSYFRGVGAGIELIAQDGEILYPFQHLRLHEVPLTGGGSSFRVSTDIEPVLLQAAAKLIKALNWTGVAMVEFKWDPTSGRYCLMEINGRLWGSLPLATAAGADFPAMLAELALTGSLEEYPAYRRGVYCRNLGSDLMWHEMVLRSRGGSKQNNAMVQIPTGKEVLQDIVKTFSPRHYFDTQSLRDPLPGAVEIKRLIAHYFKRVSGIVVEKRFARRQRQFWYNGTVREKMRRAKTVLFLCYGNINRSALAETILSSLLPRDAGKRVLSAGFHEQAGRTADHRMQAIAAENNFDLSHCRSTCITEQLLANSDIIFVMERRHYDDLLAINQAVEEKTFLLGPGGREQGRGVTEILDPYNHSERVYRACFGQVHQAVLRLHELSQAKHVR